MPPAFRLVALGVFVIPALTAQKHPAPVSSPSNTSGPAMTAPSQAPANPSDQWPDSQTPIMLSGTVVIEGGGEPASNIAVQRLCENSNVPRTMAWTDAKGQFSFRWNDSTASLSEASEPGVYRAPLLGGPSTTTPATGNSTNTGRLPGSSMRGCELLANAPGFRSDRLDLSEHRALDNADLGNIVLHRISRVKESSVSASTLYAPKDARKAWERGVQLLHSEQQADTAVAETEFAKAVRIYPKFAEAWLGLGRACQRERKEDRAREAFLNAISADDKLVEPFIELGMIASRHRRWPEAAQYLDRALQLNPVDYPHLWYDDAEADYYTGKLDRAEKNVREALKAPVPNREPGALRLLSMVLLSKQDYAGADIALRTYMQEYPDIQDWDELQTTLETIRGHIPAKQ